MKFFSVDEAEAMIPRLEEIFEAVAELAAQAESKAAALRRRKPSGAADEAALAIERSQLQFLAQAIDERMHEIMELGAVPKGIEPALVDFPGRVEGRDVYLCWKLGEKKITHYHGMDDGFSGRQPLPKRRPN